MGTFFLLLIEIMIDLTEVWLEVVTAWPPPDFISSYSLNGSFYSLFALLFVKFSFGE